MDEESFFVKLRTFESFCNTCTQFVTLNQDYNTWDKIKICGPKYVTNVHTNPGDSIIVSPAILVPLSLLYAMYQTPNSCLLNSFLG